MAFMIVGVMFFFVLVGLFFLGWQYKSLRSGYEDLQQEQTLSSMKSIAGMAELNCEDSREFCLDEDKLNVMMKQKNYSDIWPVVSVEVIKIPANRKVNCPGVGCNYYKIYDSGQKNVKKYSTYVSLCKKLKENSYIYEKCEIAKLYAGVKLIE